jgi:hypothetical protein
MPSLESLGARVIAYIVGAVIVVFVVWAAIHFYTKSRSQAAQIRVDHAQTGAFTNSAGDAVNTQANVAQNEAASGDLTRTNEEDIRNAQGSGDKVNPAARDAGLRSLCRRAAYRDSQQCRMLQPRP